MFLDMGEQDQNIVLKLNGLSKGSHAGSLTTYSADNLDGENSFEEPTRYIPQSRLITVEGSSLDITIPAKSFAMYKIKQ